MSDRDLILRLLKAVERRLRRNRILREVSAGLSLALLAPVVFKLLDFFFLFRTSTVAVFFGLWAALTAAWLIWKSQGKDPLDRIAASIDKTADTHDQIKTAYWFIRNPKPSVWVDAQIERAARNAGSLQVDRLYPRTLPRSVWTSAALFLVLGVLNFLPLPWNNNWFYLKGAPAFSLTDADKELLKQAMELLKKAEELQKSPEAEKLAAIIRALQDGSMSRDQLSRSLSELQQALAERNLDAGRITDGLERIAKALQPSALTQPTAAKLFALDLKGAASEVRKIAGGLDTDPQTALKEMAERFQEASEVAGKGLEQLSSHMKATADAMQRRDIAAGRQGLERTAQEFERLQKVLESQRLRNEASQQISEIQGSVEGTPGDVSGGEEVASLGEEGEGDALADGSGSGTGDGEGTGTGVGQGEGEGQGQGEGEGEAQGDGEGDGNGEGTEGGGRGGKQAGTSGPFPARGEPTSLETKLDREPIPVKPTRGSRPETIEEASQKERSKLDYRNVPSELSPAQKDLLNQDPIPWEQRRFVKEYFETIRK